MVNVLSITENKHLHIRLRGCILHAITLAHCVKQRSTNAGTL
jgi:hypothetical protein